VDSSHSPKQTTPLKSVDVLCLGQSKFVIISPNRLQFYRNISPQKIKEKVELERRRMSKPTKESSNSSPETAFIGILPTFACNLRCIYCYAKGGEKAATLNKPTIRRFIDFARDRFGDKDLRISFIGGGEPLLAFDLVRDAVDYARSRFPEVYPSVVTNGTFDHNVRDWVVSNKVELRISYDGLFQEKQRPAVNPDDQAQIEENINFLANERFPFIIQSVVTSLSVNSMAENALFLYKRGARNIKFEPAHISKVSRGDQSLTPPPESFVRNFLKTVDLIVEKDLQLKSDTGFLSRPTTGYYCGIYENMNLCPGGLLSPCVEVASQDNPFSKDFIYGKFSPSRNEFIIDAQKRERFAKMHYSNFTPCSTCNLKLVCNSGCPARTIFENGFAYKPSQYHCEITKRLLPKIFERIMDNQKVADVLMDGFVLKRC
jgi:uncharacterized protein